MPEKKLLELQSDRIEMVLSAHHLPCRVTGGVVTPRMVRFDLFIPNTIRVDAVLALADELATALGAPVKMQSVGTNLVELEIPRKDAPPIRLLPLMKAMLVPPKPEPGERPTMPTTIPFATAVLGMCDDGAPLLVRLPAESVTHILVGGVRRAGKTTLLSAMIASLAIRQSKNELLFVLFDTNRSKFSAFARLPHLYIPVVTAPPLTALESLVTIMQSRRDALDKISHPRIVVVVDELANLQTREFTLLDGLLHYGGEVGMHVIASTERPRAINSTLMRRFPLRIVGRSANVDEAYAIAGRKTGAEKLANPGEFLAVAGGLESFQAALITPAEIREVVTVLAGGRQWDFSRVK